MTGLDWYVSRFLKPYKTLVIDNHKALFKEYPTVENQYIYYENWLYHACIKREVVPNYSLVDFDGDLPDSVLKYIHSVDRYMETRQGINSLFRKMENNYSDSEAQMFLPHIAELPTMNVDTWVKEMQEILADIQKNNQEQLKLIELINMDTLILKG